ncbi:hypothetical protein BpHYR1_024414 [Brachionus plicatilis]|uniref:Uncharacterized protein n=1 Tax=Brachionus plicatilis TaxID=10195 RepID=A0A3M7S6D5_BRAPC|nr:hypothetical protein BpHYR1_024414 [Brachionus plicatilis]
MPFISILLLNDDAGILSTFKVVESDDVSAIKRDDFTDKLEVPAACVVSGTELLVSLCSFEDKKGELPSSTVPLASDVFVWSETPVIILFVVSPILVDGLLIFFLGIFNKLLYIVYSTPKNIFA